MSVCVANVCASAVAALCYSGSQSPQSWHPGACPAHGYCSQRFLLKLKKGKARWPPIPFRDMLPKPEGLPLRTEKVRTAGVFSLKPIVSLQMGPLQWSSSRGYSQLSLPLCHPGLSSLEHFIGSWCCYCSFWNTLDLGCCVWVFGLSFPGGF